MVIAASSSSPRSVLFLAFPGVQMLDLVGPLEIFAGANEMLRRLQHRQPAYSIAVLSATGRPVIASNGQRIDVQRALRTVRGPVDTLVVPGSLDISAAQHDRSLVRWIRRTAPRTRRIAGVCSGAFLLAAAGLLDGRNATTHWAGCARLQKLHPKVRVDAQPIFVRDGSVYTSAGVTAGMDLALALVEEDLGRSVALELARWFVMFLKRPGGQAQFSTHLQTQFLGSPPIEQVLHWIASNPAGNLTVDALARRQPEPSAFRTDFSSRSRYHGGDSRAESAARVRASGSGGVRSTPQNRRRAIGLWKRGIPASGLRDHLGVTPADYGRRFRRAQFPEKNNPC